MALNIKQVQKSDIPKSALPGRVRKDSEFDDFITAAYEAWKQDPETAWFAVEYDGSDERFNELKNELTRAASAHNVGKTARAGKDENGIATFWFQIRDKIKSGPKGPRNSPENVDESGTETPDVATNESEPVAEANDAPGRKPRRRDSVGV